MKSKINGDPDGQEIRWMEGWSKALADARRLLCEGTFDRIA